MLPHVAVGKKHILFYTHTFLATSVPDLIEAGQLPVHVGNETSGTLELKDVIPNPGLYGVRHDI